MSIASSVEEAFTEKNAYTMTMEITGGENNDGTSSAAAATTIKEEPLLVASAKCSYSELLALVETLDFASKKECSRGRVCVLPPELAYRVVQCLVIQRVDPEQVETVSCSSHDEAHPLTACLSDDETSWWISGPHSMPQCRGYEYIQLSLGPTPQLRRLTAVSIKIPPLPQGPLSVREFRIESPMTTGATTDATDATEWTAVTPVFTVENRTGFQRFVLDTANPVDVHQVRLVCLSNQISSFIDGLGVDRFNTTLRFECVGFFAVRFE
jgi:hypothetical protein